LDRVKPAVRPPSIWYSTEKITPSATVAGGLLLGGEQPKEAIVAAARTSPRDRRIARGIAFLSHTSGLPR
jgi:hypothetical protein